MESMPFEDQPEGFEIRLRFGPKPGEEETS